MSRLKSIDQDKERNWKNQNALKIYFYLVYDFLYIFILYVYLYYMHIYFIYI